MKTLFYLLLLVGITSCTTYNASSQSPNQYTSVSEQIIIEEPATVTYINYVPTFTFASYYNYNYYWGWRKYYFDGYPMYLNDWNPYPRRRYWNSYAWNPHYSWSYNYYNWNHHHNWNYHHNHHNPFFTPVAHHNHHKPNHIQHKSISKNHNQVVSHNKPLPVKRYKPNNPQPTRNYHYTKPQPRTQPTRQPNINIQRKSYGQPRPHSRNR